MGSCTDKVILLIDSDDRAANDLRRVIEKYGYSVIIADSGKKAHEVIDSDTNIDLVMLDASLDKGTDVIATAQSILDKRDLPLIFLTTEGSEHEIRKSENIVTYGFIDKGSKAYLVIATIKTALRIYEIQRKLWTHVNRNAALIRVIPDLLFVIDRNGFYREIYASDDDLLALPPEELIGKSLSAVFSQDAVNSFLESFRVCLETGKLQALEYELTVNKERRFFRARITRFNEDSVLSVVQDITESKKAKNKIESLNSLLLSIRNVNQLIVQEDDLLAVMRGASEILVETWQYLNIEISLIDERTGKISPVTSAGKLGHGDWFVIPEVDGNAPTCINDAVKERRTIELEDYQTYCKDCPYFSIAFPHKKIVIPMLENDQLIGLMCVSTTPEQVFFAEEIELLEEVAADLVYAGKKLKAEQKIKEKNRLLTILNDYSMELSSVTVSNNIYSLISHKLKEITNAKFVSISIYEEKTSSLIVKFTTISEESNKKLSGIIGRKLEELRMKVTPEMYRRITQEVVGDAGSLEETTFGSIPKVVSNMIQKVFGVEWFTGIALMHKESLVGTVVIIGDKETKRPDNEDLKAFAGVTANALQRWKAEKSLLESHSKWQFALEGTGDGIWDWDIENGKVNYSANLKKMLGYEDNDLESTMQQKEKLIHSEDLSHYRKKLQSHLKDKTAFFSDECRMLCRDGSYKWVLDRGKVIRRSAGKSPLRMIGVQTDLSYLKETEQELRESEYRYTTIVNNAYDGIILQNAQGEILTWNKAAARILGISEKRVVGHTSLNREWDTIREDGSAYPKEEHPSMITLKTGKPCRNVIMGFKKRSGKVTWININTSPLFKSEDPQPYAVIISLSDITEIKKADKSLKESELRYRLIFENSKDAMMTLEPPTWRFTSGNSAIFDMFKAKDLAEFTACEPWKLSPEKQPDGTLSEEKAKRMIEIAMRKGSSFFEWTHRRLTGEEFSATVLLTRIEMSGSRFLHATVRDISERKRDETIRIIQANIAHAVSVAESLYELYEIVREELSTLLDTRNCFIAFYDETTGMFSTPFEKDVKDSIKSWAADGSLTGYVLKRKRAILLSKERIEKMAEAGRVRKIGTTAESWLGVPIKIDGKYKAVFVVQNYKNKNAYDKNSVELLRLIAEQLSIYIDHKKAEDKLAEERKQLLSIFDSIDEAIYISDPETYEILFVNKTLKSVFGKDLIGGICYRELQNRETPCEFCTNDKILKNKGSSYNWEHNNLHLQRDFLITDKIIKWTDGRDVRFEIARDFTESKKAQERVKDLNSLLMAIRNVNQLIVQEDDLFKVMQNSCEILLETRQYLNIEISLLDESEEFIRPYATSGEHEKSDWQISLTGEGSVLKCIKETVLTGKSVVVSDPDNYCRTCPEINDDSLHETVVIPISQNERPVGLMRTCMIQGHKITQDEIDLLEEVAGDLGFARAKILAEKSLQSSEELFRNLYENATIGIYRTTPEGEILLANQSLITMLGFESFEELKNRNLEKDYFEARYSRKSFRERLDREGFVKGLETSWRLMNGKIITVLESARVIRDNSGNPLYYEGTVEDITDNKRDAVIKEVQYNIAHAVASAKDISELYEIVRDELAKLIDTTNFYIAQYNVAADEFSSPYFIDERDNIAVWDAKKSLTGYVLKQKKAVLVNKEELLKLYEMREVDLIGEVAANWLGVPVRITGNVWGVIVVQSYEEKDIYDDHSIRILELIANQLSIYIERKLGEESLQESERKQAALLANLPGMSYRCKNDRDWTMEFVSDGCLDLTGYRQEELLLNEKLSFNELIFPEYREMLWEKWQEILARKEDFAGEYKILTKDGQEKWVWEQGSGVYTEEGEVIALEGFITDITERKQAEEDREVLEAKLIQAQKMDAIGRLAGGVAHDYNNMLGVILGHTEMILADMDPHDPNYPNLKEIKKATERSADLTKQLLAFARKQTIFPKKLNLNSSIDDMLRMLQRLIGENIELSWKPAADLWSIKIDPTQLNQILTNLCINSRDAIEGIGKITIFTENVTFDQEFCADHPGYKCGEFVLLSVQDNGHGMDQETLKNIFEPFYTTKKVGEGSGLGLSTIYGIVQQNEGFVNVYSELNEGTIFKIYLPRVVSDVTTVQAEVIPEKAVRCGNETILLVEDEMSILSMLKSMLENSGYTVLAANSPEEAFGLAGENKDKINMLITDMIMPQMNGYDLALKLKTEISGLKVLFMSGYIDYVLKNENSLDFKVNYIQKPFSFKEFLAMVRNLLDS